MTATTLPPLSNNDLTILGAIFDPETSLSRPSKNTTTPSTSHLSITTNTVTTPPSSDLLTAERNILKSLNTPEPSTSTLNAAIAQLDTLITNNPTHSSLYTNRAQATRLLPKSLTNPPHLSSILSDLHIAISLQNTPSTVLITAHTHRAYILLCASQTPEQLTTLLCLDCDFRTLGLPDKQHLSESKLEDLASRDFAIAGDLGDEKARKMSVRTNPYAKMCGAIVKEALREEIRGFYEGRS